MFSTDLQKRAQSARVSAEGPADQLSTASFIGTRPQRISFDELVEQTTGRAREAIAVEMAGVAREYGGCRLLDPLYLPRGHCLVTIRLAMLGRGTPTYSFPQETQASQFLNDPRILQHIGPVGAALITIPGPLYELAVGAGRFFVGLRERIFSPWRKA